MSDFLQFKDEIIDGNAKYYITDNADNTKNITLANAIVNEGTSLNRVTLQKINRIMGYEKISGIYNPTIETVEYNSNYFNASEVVDNMRLLVQGANKVQVPADDFVVIKSSTSIGTHFYSPQLIEMSNGNIMIVGNQSSTGYLTILDQQGNVIKSTTSIGSGFVNSQLIEMSN